MELTRRDAIAALAAIGATGGAAFGYTRLQADGSEEMPDDNHVLDTMVAVAEIVYPSEVSGTEQFVEAFLTGRLDDSDHATGIDEGVAKLDDHTQAWHDSEFLGLDRETRESALIGIGAADADEDPDGTPAEQVRYYVVNELLLALYASPTGGELVGIENPQGHAGGTESYQRGPGVER